MNGRVVLVLASFLSVALAGCSGEEPSQEKKFQEAVTDGLAADVPTWAVGDFWTYKMSAMDTEIGKSSFVVTGEQGADYIVETDTQTTAYFDARFDISFMGPIRKSDLAGSQGSERVAMFQWPLEAGKTWKTTWDGDELDMAASSMGPNQFHVMGHRSSDDAMTVDYHYNAETKWFEYIVFYDPDNGTPAFRLDLESSGASFQGEIFRYSFGQVHHISAAPEQTGMGELPIDAQWNELQVTMHGDCGGAAGGVVAIGLSSPEYAAQTPLPMLPMGNEPEYGLMATCHDTPSAMDSFTVTNNGGTWDYGLVSGAPGAYTMLVIEERALTVLPFPFA